MEKKKKISVAIATIIGFLLTVKLAIIYYNANFNPFALSSFCSINEFIDCDGIAQTKESQFFGIPLALWGMFLYAFIGLMLVVDKLKNVKLLKFLEVFKNPAQYIASLGIISFTISMILLCESLFSIKKLCILCFCTYIVNLIIGIIAAKGIGIVNSFKQSFTDFIDAIKIKKYAIAFTAVMLCACAVLSYTTLSYVLAPQVKRQKQFAEFTKAKHNKYTPEGNILGNKDAEIIVHVYSDYRCPMCKAYDIMVAKLATKEFKNIRVEHHNMPLDMECNKYMRGEFHQGSCMMARYAVAAEKQGKLWEMNAKLFEKQPNNEKEIMEIAREIGLDTEKLSDDALSLETQHIINNDIDQATQLGINGTPATVINGKVEVGIKPYDKMKEWLRSEGAK